MHPRIRIAMAHLAKAEALLDYKRERFARINGAEMEGVTPAEKVCECRLSLDLSEQDVVIAQAELELARVEFRHGWPSSGD